MNPFVPNEGKTLDFLLPVLNNLNKESKGVQCLILVPSRELALQGLQISLGQARGRNDRGQGVGHRRGRQPSGVPRQQREGDVNQQLQGIAHGRARLIVWASG